MRIYVATNAARIRMYFDSVCTFQSGEVELGGAVVRCISGSISFGPASCGQPNITIPDEALPNEVDQKKTLGMDCSRIPEDSPIGSNWYNWSLKLLVLCGIGHPNWCPMVLWPMLVPGLCPLGGGWPLHQQSFRLLASSLRMCSTGLGNGETCEPGVLWVSAREE